MTMSNTNELATALAEELGAAIQDAREQMEWAREHAAECAGLSVATINRLERGKGSMQTLQQYLDALGIDAADLVGAVSGAVPLTERLRHTADGILSGPRASRELTLVGDALGLRRLTLVARGSAGTIFDAAVIAAVRGGWGDVLSSWDVPVVELAEVA